jgi:hypothetical protein
MLGKRVRDVAAVIALAAGRHHITNFDAELGRDAAPSHSALLSKVFVSAHSHV